MDVINGGVIDTLGAGQVDTVRDLLVTFLAHDEDILTETIDVQLTHGEGFEEGDTILVDIFDTGAGTTQDGERHLVETYGDDGVLTEALVDEVVLNLFLDLLFVLKRTAIPEDSLTWRFSPLVKPLKRHVSSLW